MKFLVDAQLPARLARVLRDAGHDAIHCQSLPNGNRSTDAEIASIADADDRVVITKDRGFRDGHLLRGVPRRLLLVGPSTVPRRMMHRQHVKRASRSRMIVAVIGSPDPRW